MSTTFRRRPQALAQLREGVAYGMLNFGYAVETGAKREAPVRGGHRSFMTGPKTKAGTPRIGGTLRRSILTAAFLDGQPLAQRPDENGNAPPAYAARPGIVVYIGTNCGYGAYVELGTVKMAARPYLVPAFLAERGNAPALIAAGARKRLGR